jgi:filamentous hemagglutinin
VSYSNTHVSAGNVVTIDSGGDANLRGTVVSGKQVVADVGGDLNLQSLQDSSSFDGKQQNIGGSVTIGAGFSASVSYSNSKAKGDYASVTEQTGIQAGDGGFQVNVAGNTDLKGAVIASTQDAVDHNRNHLTTGTLTASDINNHSDHSASGVNLSGGISVAGSKPAQKPSGTGGTDSAGGGTVNNGPNWSWQNLGKTGVNGAAAGFSSDSGSASSTTHSGISGGTLTITDEAGQQQKTGQTAKEAADSIKRDVLAGADSGALSKNWEGQKLLQEQAANAQIMATFGQQASKAVGTYAGEQAKNLREQAKQASDEVTKQSLMDEAQKWDEGGAYRVAMHGVVGALGGGVSGAVGAVASASAAKLMEDLQAGIAGALTGSGVGDKAAEVASKLVSGLTAAGVGAAVGGAQGAAAAGNADFNNGSCIQMSANLSKSLPRIRPQSSAAR